MSDNRHGFVYSLWTGKLTVMEGTFRPQRGNGFGPWRRTCYFESNAEHKILECSSTPGEVYNAMVWFKERNDEKAKRVLIDYQIKQIVKLEEKIAKHKQKIKLIQEGLV